MEVNGVELGLQEVILNRDKRSVAYLVWWTVNQSCDTGVVNQGNSEEVQGL